MALSAEGKRRFIDEQKLILPDLSEELESIKSLIPN